MRFIVIILLLSLTLTAQVISETTAVLHTDKGDITIKLYDKEAPVTVANFIKYAREGRYNDTVFHRVIRGSIIQGGGFTLFNGSLRPIRTFPAIVNEAANGLYNTKMMVAMARADDPNSATSQFFINLKSNAELNSTTSQPGYAVFGRITAGWDVVTSIANGAVKNAGIMDHVPLEPVVVKTVEIIEK